MVQLVDTNRGFSWPLAQQRNYFWPKGRKELGHPELDNEKTKPNEGNQDTKFFYALKMSV
jgi:hypothetical protein